MTNAQSIDVTPRVTHNGPIPLWDSPETRDSSLDGVGRLGQEKCPDEPGATPLVLCRVAPGSSVQCHFGWARHLVFKGRTVLVDVKGALAGSAASPPLTSPPRGAQPAITRWSRFSRASGG